MKKLGAILLVLVICLFATVTVGKNLVGDCLGFGSCPNCGSTWWNNEIGGVQYTGMKGVMICQKCLSHPEKLDSDKIGDDLRKCGWKEDDVVAATSAIERFKHGSVEYVNLTPQE